MKQKTPCQSVYNQYDIPTSSVGAIRDSSEANRGSIGAIIRIITGSRGAYKVVLVLSSLLSGPSQAVLRSSQAVFRFDNLLGHSGTLLNAHPDRRWGRRQDSANVPTDGGGSDGDEGDANRPNGRQRRNGSPYGHAYSFGSVEHLVQV